MEQTYQEYMPIDFSLLALPIDEPEIPGAVSRMLYITLFDSWEAKADAIGDRCCQELERIRERWRR